MEIRIKETGAVVFYSELRSMYPDVSGPLDDLYDVVLEGPQAQPTRYQIAFRDGVEQIKSNWYTKYSVADLDADGVAAKDAAQAASVRAERNARLAACDWTQLADSAADKNAWANCRQNLRDISTQPGFPWEVIWPDAP
jgi:hypothetical protein